jgi:hypothetical protein
LIVNVESRHLAIPLPFEAEKIIFVVKLLFGRTKSTVTDWQKENSHVN